MKYDIYRIKDIRYNTKSTTIKLTNGKLIILRPFLYLKKNDFLKFIPSVDEFKEIYKIFDDRATHEAKEIKVHPPYKKKEEIFLPPHKFEVVFRERIDEKDWKCIKDLEKFHYRGKGLNRIVGRRTVLLAELKDFGIIGFGIVSSSVAACAPRFRLLNTNFTEQMKSGLINRIVRIPRVVIHPEYRGINLGVLMARHLVNYAKQYWDINHYTPIMVEVIAAMLEYHKFFEKAGFKKVGYTLGYKDTAIKPKYGNGSFAPRDPSGYRFIQNQNKKPYLVFPLSSYIKEKLKPYTIKKKITIINKNPKLSKPLIFDKLSIRYKVRNRSTDRTEIIKEVFGIDSEQAFSPVIEDFSLRIDPGEIVLFTGASGSGKSTILKLFNTSRELLSRQLDWSGSFPYIKDDMVETLNITTNNMLPLIDRIRSGRDIKEAIELLNSVGLTEAYLYIKRPSQLSEGQKYRFSVAKLADSEKPIWVADEFLSSLNPEMAAIVAKGIRKIAYKHGATLILAAPHTSYFVESLLPNKIVKLSWRTRPYIFSLKISKLYQNGIDIHLSIMNNGQSPLTDLRIGFQSDTGKFISFFKKRNIKINETVSVSCKLPRRVIRSLIIKTRENVGDVIYFN